MSGYNEFIDAANHDILDRPELRVFDSTTYLDPTPDGSPSLISPCPAGRRSRPAHIPGADFLDLQGEFSDPGTQLRFMMPPVAPAGSRVRPARHRARRAGGALQHRHDDVATRFWWMLRSLGFDDAAVLMAASTNGRPRAGRPKAARRRDTRRRPSRPRRARPVRRQTT